MSCCNSNEVKPSHFNHLTSELKNNVGITMVILSQEECPFCQSFTKSAKILLEKINKEKEILRIFRVSVDDLPEVKLFPHHVYPTIYFWVKGYNFPLIRDGGAPIEAVEHEINKLIRILNGEKWSDVYDETV